jgi:hypothetical protein
MKIYIGPYRDWYGPYQIADLLRYIGFSEERCDRVGKWLNNTRLLEFCEWVHSKRKRTVKIKIDDYDAWGVDHTLALIVVPLLKRLKEKKQGAPHVDDEDVPDRLKSTNAPPLTEEEKNYGSPDANWFHRWEWILDEVIWSFNQILDEESELQFSKDKDPSKPSNEPGLSFRESMNRMDFDIEAYKAHQDRIQNGMCLFGKYLRGMWD